MRRSAPRLARPLSAVLPAFAPPSQPLLLLGCPRAGTSVLLQALLVSPRLSSVQSEGHILWDEFHHPRDHGWDSDALGAGDVTQREREYVYAALRLFTRGRRFVDKTPESCLRVAYLDALFPDARFVFLRRRAADNVNSLIEGWRARPRFVKYRLPERLEGLGPLSGDRWSFVLVPGWRALRRAPVEEICAHQYVACNEAVLATRERIDPARWTDLTYEELVADPVAQLGRLFARLGIPFGAEERRFAAALPYRPSATALTVPRPEKWREQNPDAVERILPLVQATESRLGYGTA
jgi:Sulfotransferase family